MEKRQLTLLDLVGSNTPPKLPRNVTFNPPPPPTLSQQSNGNINEQANLYAI